MGRRGIAFDSDALDTQVHQHPQLFFNLFYGTVSTVRNALRVEHLDLQDIDKWMVIPDMDYHITCRYNVIFVSLSKRLNIIFFSLFLVLPMYRSRHKIIVVDFVNNHHWIQVKLKLNYPLAPVTDGWKQYCTE
ncbi:unnamed protein product [Lathyrus oleraceus]